jgi:hypothetical protein
MPTAEEAEKFRLRQVYRDFNFVISYFDYADALQHYDTPWNISPWPSEEELFPNYKEEYSWPTVLFND